jgi:hypothetical protein
MGLDVHHHIGKGGAMERSLGELETIIRATVCRVCTDRNNEGSCGLEDPRNCALFRLFPQVARAIQTTHSDDICDYVKAIREQVCSVCRMQDAEGHCETREKVECALDAYLLLVVDAIEDATGRKFLRPIDFIQAPPLVPLTIN